MPLATMPTMPGSSTPVRTPPPAGMPVVAAPPAPRATSTNAFQTPVSYFTWTVPEYERMVAVGLLKEDEPIELLEGYLVKKMPRNNSHDHSIRRINPRLVKLLPDEWTVQCQCAVVFDTSKPEPDFSIARGNESTYAKRQPRSSDIAFVIEVCDSSLNFDRVDKARIYARAGIPVYWVVNAIDGEIEVMTDPSGSADEPAYRTQTLFKKGENVPVVLDGTTVGSIPVDEII